MIAAPLLLGLWRHAAMPGTPRRYLLAFLASLLVGVLTGPAHAQEAEVVEVLGTEGSVSLEVSKGRVIRLPRPAATVFVADPEIADVQAQSPSIVYLFGRRTGTTSLYAVDENDQMLLRTSVTVQHNLSGLRQSILQLLPASRITVATIDNSIVLDGLVDSPVQAQELRELAQRYLGEEETLLYRVGVSAPTQVHLRVRVAEVSRDVLKELGINWEAIFQNSDFTFGFVTGRAVTDPLNNFLRSPTADSAFGGWQSGDDFVNTAIDALAEEGLVNVLAEPNLTALSGETASFLAGGEFPIPIDSDDDGLTIEFKEFGISLAFTPTVLNSERISLRVRPEVSDLSDKGAITIDGLTIPALTTRRAETTVELGSGQSFAIGGLLSSDIENRVRRTPGFGDLPVLGALFRSTRFQSNETELVIIVTPYLVRPVDERQMAVPTDGFRAPTDIERILFGRLHGARLHPGRNGPLGPQGQRLVGPVGFVLE
ncbi:MAG: type II and III secretion system protein family protein [Geminicoccaceae bacterium]